MSKDRSIPPFTRIPGARDIFVTTDSVALKRASDFDDWVLPNAQIVNLGIVPDGATRGTRTV